MLIWFTIAVFGTALAAPKRCCAEFDYNTDACYATAGLRGEVCAPKNTLTPKCPIGCKQGPGGIYDACVADISVKDPLMNCYQDCIQRGYYTSETCANQCSVGRTCSPCERAPCPSGHGGYDLMSGQQFACVRYKNGTVCPDGCSFSGGSIGIPVCDQPERQCPLGCPYNEVNRSCTTYDATKTAICSADVSGGKCPAMCSFNFADSTCMPTEIGVCCEQGKVLCPQRAGCPPRMPDKPTVCVNSMIIQCPPMHDIYPNYSMCEHSLPGSICQQQFGVLVYPTSLMSEVKNVRCKPIPLDCENMGGIREIVSCPQGCNLDKLRNRCVPISPDYMCGSVMIKNPSISLECPAGFTLFDILAAGGGIAKRCVPNWYYLP